jgi:hypothetical protein
VSLLPFEEELRKVARALDILLPVAVDLAFEGLFGADGRREAVAGVQPAMLQLLELGLDKVRLFFVLGEGLPDFSGGDADVSVVTLDFFGDFTAGAELRPGIYKLLSKK